MATRQISFTTALKEALAEEMAADSRVILLGEDVATYGGVYKVSQGLLERFGPDRVRDTPISEAAIVGAGVVLPSRALGRWWRSCTRTSSPLRWIRS